jgi:hypothetical protein
VARVLAQAGLPPPGAAHRPSAIDPYLPFILEPLTQYPRLHASRLYDIVKDRGYPGRSDHFRHIIARHLPHPKSEADTPTIGRRNFGESLDCHSVDRLYDSV